MPYSITLRYARNTGPWNSLNQERDFIVAYSPNLDNVLMMRHLWGTKQIWKHTNKLEDDGTITKVYIFTDYGWDYVQQVDCFLRNEFTQQDHYSVTRVDGPTYVEVSPEDFMFGNPNVIEPNADILTREGIEQERKEVLKAIAKEK